MKFNGVIQHFTATFITPSKPIMSTWESKELNLIALTPSALYLLLALIIRDQLEEKIGNRVFH